MWNSGAKNHFTVLENVHHDSTNEGSKRFVCGPWQGKQGP